MDQRLRRFIALLVIGDALLTPAGLYIASLLRERLPFGKVLGPEGAALPLPIYIVSVLCWLGALLLSGVYNIERPKPFISHVTRLVSAAFTATILMAGFLYLTYRQVSRLQFGYAFIITLSMLLLFRLIIRLATQGQPRSLLFSPIRVVFIGAGDLAQDVVRTLRDNRYWGYQVIGFLDDAIEYHGQTIENLPILGRLEDLLTVIEDNHIAEVWSTLPPRAYDQIHALVSRLETIPVRIKVIPDYFSLALVQAHVEMLGGFPLIGLREPLIRGFPRLVKRSFDLIVSAFLMILFSPLLLLIGVVIRIDSAGPILFRQVRVGENAKLFEMLKFRTMIPNAEAQVEEVLQVNTRAEIVHKISDDPRVTRAGRFLRRYSLDELPQLLNVFRGDMSLVGPRPELPWLVERYKPWQRKRFAVPQGITGWWQINGRSEKPMHLNTDEDLYYIYNYSLWLDILILLKTPLAVIQGKGAF
jgi:exopolysaccharide biosynthesis polyprenyl glycosylphosphotransferase